MYGYIYLTTNLINNMIYIGQHKSTRFSKSYKGSGVLIKRALKEHGRENFKVELLEWCNSFEELNEREKYWEQYYGLPNFDIGYNITKGGQTNFFNECKHKESTKQIMSEKKLGIKFSEERCRKISEGKKGIPQTPEAGLKRSKTLKEKYAKEGRVSNHKGHPLSEESKKKMSEAAKGRKLSDETKRKMSESHKNGKHKPHKKHNYPKNRKSKLNKENSSNSGKAQIG